MIALEEAAKFLFQRDNSEEYEFHTEKEQLDQLIEEYRSGVLTDEFLERTGPFIMFLNFRGELLKDTGL